jgi:hypothetical protein
MSGETSGDCESSGQFFTGSTNELPAIPADWLAEFEAAARRPLEVRMRYSFIHTYKPVMDDASYRSFDSMEEYRRWCEENLPSWLGYGRV